MTITITIKPWLARKEEFASRELTGTVIRATAKAIQFDCTAVVRESDHCLRCGREIENPVSRLAGYGPWCSDRLGIPRDFTADEIAAIREKVKVESHRVLWLPRSAIVSHDGPLEPTVPAPVAAPVERPVDNYEDVPPPESGDFAAPGEWVAPSSRAMAETYGTIEHPVEIEQEPESAPECSLTVVGSVIQARLPYRLKDAVKAIVGRRWDPKAKVWTVPATPSGARALLDLVAGISHQVDPAVRALVEQDVRRDEVQEHKHAEELPPVPSKTDAWHHQRQAFWFARDLDAVMLAMDMGTGKSKVTVDLTCDRGAQRTLILCPRSVLGVWPREFARHASCDVNVVAPQKGTITKRAALVKAALEAEGPTVVCVNYEAAWRGEMSKLLLSVAWDQVVLDESHRVKAPGGKASLFVARLRTVSRQRICLTGTPMPHSPLDVYAQYRFLDPGVFGTSFNAFRSRYAVMGGYQGREVLGFKNQDDLANRMYRIGYRVMADDVLDLPEAIHTRRTTELTGAARSTYDALAKDLYAEVEAGSITATNALTKLLRLQQVTSGHTVLDDDPESDEDTRRTVEVGTEKRDLLADVIEDLPTGEPVVVFCRFTHDLDSVRIVAEKQGRRYGELSGRRRDGLTDLAEMSPDVDVIGVQVQAGGVGIDLTRAHYCVFYSVGFSLGDYDQALRRVHRPGQTQTTHYYHLVCEGTIDEGVYDALSQRKDLVEYVLNLSK